MITDHSQLPRHCGTCGADWAGQHHGLCLACNAGLPCRADTTDTVAPDPPCLGSRLRAQRKDAEELLQQEIPANALQLPCGCITKPGTTDYLVECADHA